MKVMVGVHRSIKKYPYKCKVNIQINPLQSDKSTAVLKKSSWLFNPSQLNNPKAARQVYGTWVNQQPEDELLKIKYQEEGVYTLKLA